MRYCKMTASDVVTMRTMRENGKTNKEISAMMGCSADTVRRCIGKLSPAERAKHIAEGKARAPYTPAMKPISVSPVNIAEAKPETKPIRNLLITSMLVQMKGKHYFYYLDTGDKTITLSRTGCPDLILTVDELCLLQSELEELHTMMGTVRKEVQ